MNPLISLDINIHRVLLTINNLSPPIVTVWVLYAGSFAVSSALRSFVQAHCAGLSTYIKTHHMSVLDTHATTGAALEFMEQWNQVYCFYSLLPQTKVQYPSYHRSLASRFVEKQVFFFCKNLVYSWQSSTVNCLHEDRHTKLSSLTLCYTINQFKFIS